jgi:hypothetical protein
MKFAVTAVAMSRATRRRVGKARVEVIDTKDNLMFRTSKTPADVEAVYESFWNDLNPNSEDVVKVVDVRRVD